MHTHMIPAILHSKNWKMEYAFPSRNFILPFWYRWWWASGRTCVSAHKCDARSILLAYFRGTHIFWWNINTMVVTQKFICIYVYISLLSRIYCVVYILKIACSVCFLTDPTSHIFGCLFSLKTGKKSNFAHTQTRTYSHRQTEYLFLYAFLWRIMILKKWKKNWRALIDVIV